MTNEPIFYGTSNGDRRITVAFHDENILETGELKQKVAASKMETALVVGPDNGSSIVAILQPLK